MNRISLFSQSLFALPLYEAIAAAGAMGFEAIELACIEPHFSLERALREPGRVRDAVIEAGLKTSALSLFTGFTDPAAFDEQLDAARVFIGLGPMFETRIIKITPGAPASASADEGHWERLGAALDRLIPAAEDAGVRLAFETHMRQLTDTFAGTKRLLELAGSNTVGLTVDFSNLRFAGEDLDQVIGALHERIYNTHIKNGHIDEAGGWHFGPLEAGLTDYRAVLPSLRRYGYGGYLTIECLGRDAAEQPRETAARDKATLERLLRESE